MYIIFLTTKIYKFSFHFLHHSFVLRMSMWTDKTRLWQNTKNFPIHQLLYCRLYKSYQKHLQTIAKEYETLCEEYLKRHFEGKGFNFFHFNVDLEGGPCLSKRVSACGAGNEYFSVVPNGDLYPCHQFASDENFRMGSVFEGITRPDIREKFATSCLFTRKKCENCFAKFICSGGCSANNYHFNGDVDEPYETTCAMMKKRIECAMHILAMKKMGK